MNYDIVVAVSDKIDLKLSVPFMPYSRVSSECQL